MTTTHQTEDVEHVEATCEGCQAIFKAAVCRSPFDRTRVLFTQRRCDPCVDSAMRQRAAREQREASEEKARKLKETWDALCPVEFRTFEEGGRTDQGRLFEFPQAREIADHPQGGQGMVIRGDSGTGKSRSVWRFLRKAHESGRSIRALTSGEFDRQARDAGGNFTLTAWVDGLVSADVLFLDDIGKAQWTPNTVGQWFEVLDGRYRHGRQTVLTSNMSGETLVTQLRVARDIAEPMLRRLRETSRIIVCKKANP